MEFRFWSRTTPQDRRRLVSTLRSLGSTSVPGLAAALSWSVRRTEKVLLQLAPQPAIGISYDPRTGSVRSIPPPAPTTDAARSGAVLTVGVPGRGAAPRPGPPVPSTDRPPAPRPLTVAAPAIRELHATSAARECSRCHIPVVPTGATDEYACPMCGRRTSANGTVVSSAGPRDSSGPTAPDPRTQELLAAWATGQPVPCPRCRTPLRHHGVGEFRCRACGERVRFTSPSERLGTATAPGPAAPGPVVR